MKLTITPGHPLRGTIRLPGDKSLSHRAALLAAMAEGESVSENFLVSGVTQAMLDCLKGLGVAWRLEGTTLRVEGRGLHGFKTPNKPLDCGNSATTLRLLAGALAAAGVPAVLDGSAGLRRRPMGRILEPLRMMGVSVMGAEGDCAPVSLEERPAGQPLKGMEYRLPVASAQVKSCLLLAALAADRPTTLHEPGPSRDHTERMLRAMGVEVHSDKDGDGLGNTVTLAPPDHPLRPLAMRLPGDFSSAAFLIAAALITPGSEILLENVGLNPTRTGLLDVLQEMGADLQIVSQSSQGGEPCGDIRVRTSALRAGKVSGERVVRMIDEFPAFAAAACFAKGCSEVREAAELRLKESDRIAALAKELACLGVKVDESPAGFSIQGPARLKGGSVQPHGDHRLAMALAVIGLAAEGPVQIAGAEIIQESFPEFVSGLQSLGAEVRLEVEDES